MKWTEEKIKDGFEKFRKENGRLPTAPEIDKIEYLPSSRTIQRSFGGLQKLRKKQGYSDTNMGTVSDFQKNKIEIKRELSHMFEIFFNEQNRFPTAIEIDELDLFPPLEELEIRFGSIDKIRKALGYDEINFNKGIYRSILVKQVNKRGRNTEIFLEGILKEKFHEVFVHTEKIFDNSKVRVDFYIYNKTRNFGVDVFYTNTIKNLMKNVNVKLGKYINFKEELFFVVGNDHFTQEEIDSRVEQKENELPENIKVVNLTTFLNIIKLKEHYNDPLI